MRIFQKVAVCLTIMMPAAVSLAADNDPAAPNAPANPSVSSSMKNPGACASDQEKFCSGLQWKSGLGKCLNAHQADLSSSCKNQMASVKKEMKEFKKACNKDVNHYCSNVPHGGGQVAQCLKQNQNHLSMTCKNEIQSKDPTFFTG